MTKKQFNKLIIELKEKESIKGGIIKNGYVKLHLSATKYFPKNHPPYISNNTYGHDEKYNEIFLSFSNVKIENDIFTFFAEDRNVNKTITYKVIVPYNHIKYIFFYG